LSVGVGCVVNGNDVHCCWLVGVLPLLLQFKLVTKKFLHIHVDPAENNFCVDALGIGASS
jgi:hypothetical protein